MAERIWVIRSPEDGAVRSLTDAGCPSMLARLLVNRGVTRPEDMRAFFAPDDSAIGDPMRMKGMEAAVRRIRKAVAGGERIVVYGDYDADGVTATALMLTALRGEGALADQYIPLREGEGYGLNEAAVRRIAQDGATLIVTVDTGISAFAEAQLCKELGVDLIVTDHHEPRGELPDAFALVNPLQEGCPYPYKHLAGVGVAFKLACALHGTQEDLLERYASLVVLGTVADVVPLDGENRVLVRRGLKAMKTRMNPGVAALLEAAGAGSKELNARTIAFLVAPRINAAGRMGSASDALDLLLEEDAARASELAGRLDELNRRRRECEDRILAKALAAIGQGGGNDPVLLVGGEGWHPGVIGIVASRLAERFGKPTAVVSFEGQTGRASCRSLEGFNIHDALMRCADLLDRFGGHELAAGFTVSRPNYPELRSALQEYASGLPEMPVPKLPLEFELDVSDLTAGTARMLKKLEPFGSGNPDPLFYLSEVRVLEAVPLREGRHLKLTLKKRGRVFRAIAFYVDREGLSLSPGDLVDLAVSLDLNLYNGTESVSVIVRGARACAALEEGRRQFERLCTLSQDGPGAEAPDRDDFAAVYRCLLKKGGSVDLGGAYAELREQNASLSFFKLLVILDVFRELGLFRLETDGDRVRFEIEKGKRINLKESVLLRRLSGFARQSAPAANEGK